VVNGLRSRGGYASLLKEPCSREHATKHMSGQPLNRPRRRSPSPALILSLATLITAVNACKPLHIDDTAYAELAHHIAQHPLDPYGGTIFWYDRPEPANDILAPPVLPYWLAFQIRLFGEQPILWKIGLWPFALLFVASLAGFFRRFCSGLESPLLCMTVLSPVFLPSFNLMLDIPALALSLAALLLFMNACSRGSFALAIIAGVTAGLAMQTKYTAFLAPATMLMYALLGPGFEDARPWTNVARDLALWVVATAGAAVLFVGWEYFMARTYGASHFLAHYHAEQRPLPRRLKIAAGAILPLLGGVAAPLLPLGLLALGRRAWIVLGTIALMLAGYAGVGLVEGNMELTFNRDLLPLLPARLTWSVEQIWFAAWGLVLAGILASAAWEAVRWHQTGWLEFTPRSWRLAGFTAARLWRRHRVEWFLVGWLLLEVVGYFALTPFVAARRVMGIVVVATILLGRLGTLEGSYSSRRSLVWCVAVASMIVGGGFAALDWWEAEVRRQAADFAARYVRERDPNATVWYAGHWGFQYYAERSGMKPIIPGESALAPGDWVVVPDDSINHQKVDLEDKKIERWDDLQLSDDLPWQTVWSFYGTSIGVPLEHHAGPRVQLSTYRITPAFSMGRGSGLP
jgi:hypothetical protein